MNIEPHPSVSKKRTATYGMVGFLVVFLGTIFGVVLWRVTSNSHSYTYQPPVGEHAEDAFGKPVIYLYPTEPTEVVVRLAYQGEIIAAYPAYDETIGGWQVTAYPNGTIINTADAKEYNYLFWEGVPETTPDWDMTTGFIVAGSDTVSFLEQTLTAMGLVPREYNEFIVYWYPILQQYPYNRIHFATDTYTNIAPLTISPTPDTVARIFMVFEPLDEPVPITPQVLTPFVRNGFTVVEWGGSQVGTGSVVQ